MPSRVLFSCFRLFPFFSFTTIVIAPQKSYYIIVIIMMVVLLRRRYRSYYKSINNKYNILLWYAVRLVLSVQYIIQQYWNKIISIRTSFKMRVHRYRWIMDVIPNT